MKNIFENLLKTGYIAVYNSPDSTLAQIFEPETDMEFKITRTRNQADKTYKYEITSLSDNMPSPANNKIGPKELQWMFAKMLDQYCFNKLCSIIQDSNIFLAPQSDKNKTGLKIVHPEINFRFTLYQHYKDKTSAECFYEMKTSSATKKKPIPKFSQHDLEELFVAATMRYGEQMFSQTNEYIK